MEKKEGQEYVQHGGGGGGVLAWVSARNGDNCIFCKLIRRQPVQ